MNVACVIPTFNGRRELLRLLPSLRRQSVGFRLLIVDSSSTDGSAELAADYADEVVLIPAREFNHGGTRQKMVDAHPEFDVYVFLTQDAYLADSRAMERILAPFADPKVGAVCGRQLPHEDAGPLARHARVFNYPRSSRIKNLADVAELGLKTAYLSNSFAAYRAEALRLVGGFPNHVIFGEDMYVAAKMLLAGWKIAYAGDAECHHSHDYTAVEEFRRYFDIGVFHAREPWLRQSFGGAGGEGLRYIRSELKFLGLRHAYLWPAALWRNMLKLLAYKLGQQERRLPLWLKQRASLHCRYWDGPYAAS